MISIKQINEAVRRGEIAAANELADQYIKTELVPKSIRSYLKSASWRTQYHRSSSDEESLINLAFNTNLHVLAGPFKTHSDLVYGLQRLSFYIAPFASKITILSELKLPSALPKDNNLDQSVPIQYSRAKSQGVFQRSSKSLTLILADQPSTDNITLLDFSDDLSFVAQLRKHTSFSSVKSYGVSTTSRNEGSLFIQCVYDYLCNHDVHSIVTRAAHAARFSEFVRLNNDNEIALVCNGPSVSSLSTNNPFSKKLKAILCNTAFLNHDFKRHFDIIGLVFADPIFHFGISSYAATFREKVITEVANSEYSLTIVVPEKYAHILFHYMPSIAANIIAVPHEKIDNFNHDLTSFLQSKQRRMS